MSVWFAIPSKRPVAEAELVLREWRGMGYNLAIQRDPEDMPEGGRPSVSQLKNGLWEWTHYRPYQGYAEAVNHLVSTILRNDREAEWIVTGGDDVHPDMNFIAQQIAGSCAEHFSGTFGVMQPTGDRWGEHRNTHTFTARPGGDPALQMCSQCGRTQDNAIHSVGAYIDRVCGSPWMGREFCERINQGKGPLWEGNEDWPGYFHMGCDEELQAVAMRLGVFWQRPDLIHLHQHWGRGPGDKTVSLSAMPDFLRRANSSQEWLEYKKLFRVREFSGFPGSEPL